MLSDSTRVKEGSIEIRKVKNGDLETLRIMANRTLREEYSEELVNHLYERFNQCFMIAERDGEMIGFVLAVPVDEGTMRILMLAVDELSRRMGVGTLLMEAVKRYAMHRRARAITLEVEVNNKDAQEFYRGLGFEIIGMIQDYYRDRSNAYVMKRFLLM